VAETLPAWIKIDNAVGDLSKLIPQLKTYADLAAHWRDIALGVRELATDAPVDSPVNLASYLAANIGNAQIAQIFYKLGLSELHGKLADIGGDFVDPQAPWAKLLRPASEFVETYLEQTAENGALDDGANPGLVRLKIPKLAGDADTGLGPAMLSFALGAQVGLECEAGAVWPFRSDAVKPGLLRIGADGAVEAKAGISLPFGQIGSGSASAAGSAKAELHYFYRPARPDLVYAEALAKALVNLPNPLSLSDINHAVQLAGMEGAVVACEGAVSAGLSATLGTDFSFKQLASVSAGLVAKLEFKRNARWLLSLRNDGSGLQFVLSRALSRERDWSVGVDIGLDYSGLARQVHDALSEAVDFISPKLDSIRPFLSPGTYLSERAGGLLDATVGSIISELDLRAALLQDLGRVLGQSDSKDLALANYLRDNIVDFAASHVGGVLSDVEAWARHIAKGLTAKFPALSADDVLDKLIARIKPMLGDVKTQFDGVVTELASQTGIAKSLSDVGIELDKNLAEADQLTAGIRDVVAKFDALSKKVLEKTGEGLEHKLTARFGWTGGDSRGEQYELIGSFDQVNDEAAALWKALVTGQLEPFQRILSDPASAPVGMHLDPKSSLTRFAGKHRGFALEIVVLGLSLSIKSIVQAEASIEISAGGDVTVFATGTAEREIDGFDEGRSASFISTWDLALLKADGAAPGGQRKMGVSLKLDHSDKNLEPKEVDGFLGGLAGAGLVEFSRIQRAQEIYQGWRIANPGKKLSGRIDVGFALTASSVARMVAIGRMCGTDGSLQHRAVFNAAAQALLLSGATDTDRLDRDCREARREFKQLSKVEDTWQIVYALRTVDLTPPEVAGHKGYTYSAFGKLIELSKSFPRMLSQMAQIYDAIPVGGVGTGVQWSEKDYVRAEMALAKDARRWLRLNQKLIFWFKSDMHPAMVAFLRLLADMNQVMATSDPVDGFDAKVDVSTSSSLFAISMKSGGEKAIAV
jgi:hypothetical protein